ncbi:MAG: hypothetical protein IKG82_00305 [Oscillospiraceae bacterium]|nr:hypothetical protein [Oscillospiraceae bacterium]MBR3417117.1 hypothetical protein [Oscillospiraceae bacterium]
MTRYGNLLEAVAKGLSIKQGDTESTASYASRLIYSAVGRLMLAALHDRIEREPGDEDMVSVMHLKQKSKDILRAYIKMYPHYLSIEDVDQLIEYIYDVYAASGQMYHTSYYVSPAAYKMASNNHAALYRGLSLNIPVHMSGLGVWNPTEIEGAPDEIREMFCLSELTLEQQWNQLLSQAKWAQSELSDGVQYLNTHSFRKGYWLDQPEKNVQISVARIGMTGTETYYLYRIEERALYLSQIPSWMTEENGQYQIMNACLFAQNTLPPIRVRNDGCIVHLQISYILPPAENTLLHLYSWPASYTNIPDNFSRIMCTEIYQALKPVYEAIGFQFQEEVL